MPRLRTLLAALLLILSLVLALPASTLPAAAAVSSPVTEPVPGKVSGLRDISEGKTVAELTAAEREEDYQTFWQILEESYPFLDYLKKQGVDLEALKEAYRGGNSWQISSWDYYSFFQRIIDAMMPEGEMVGHLSIMAPDDPLIHSDFQYYAFDRTYAREKDWTTMLDSVFGNPNVLQFYQLIPETRSEEEGPPFLDIPENLHLQLVPEQDYAYAKIDSFLNENPQDVDTLLQFYRDAEAAGIANMVIDIRGNLGGYNDYWLENIVSPNITEEMAVENIGLYKASPWNRPFVNYYAPLTYEENKQDWEETPREEWPLSIFSWNPRSRRLPFLPKLEKDNVRDLDAAIGEHIWVQPENKKPLFSGKFWLLSDHRSYSASEYFISFARRTGFATVVGQPSAGDGACVLTIYNALPASGAIVRYNFLYGLNPDGSASELSSVSPDIIVADGEDALQRAIAEFAR